MAFNFWDTPLGRQMMGLPPLPPPLWKPIYEKSTISHPDNAGGMVADPVSSQYLLTMASAYYLAGVYGATVTTQPFDGAGGVEVSGATMYMLNWVDHSLDATPVPYKLNAGLLAYYYCPAPSLADPNPQPAPGAVANPDIVIAECMAAINVARLDALHKVR